MKLPLMKNLPLCWCLSTLFLAGCATPMRTLYVAPDGNDQAAGTQVRPFASLPRALAEARVRRQRDGTLDRPVTICLRGGTHLLRAPVVFTPADSGTANAPVIIRSCPGEQAVLSGGERLTGTWTQTPGKPFWQLALPRARNGGWVFYSLYVNGQSRERARIPNWGEKVFRAEGREPGGDPRQAFCYFKDDIDPSWTNPTDIDVVLLCSWTPTIHRIKEIDPARHAIRFFSAHTRTVDAWEPHFRYYLSNVFEALDQPGEWYLNRHTGTLYYYPMPGENLARAEVVAPVMRSRMITFSGDLESGHFIEHLQFRDVAFRHLDGDMDTYNGVYRQGHMYLTAAVSAKGLRHAAFEHCEFSQLGEYALELADGCRDVAVRQCHFWDLGAGALQLGVTDLATLKGSGKTAVPSPASLDNPRFVTGLTVDNCCIHRLGTIWHGCYGIVNRFASRTRMTHNDIFDVHWDAIGLDARWDWKGVNYSCGNEIAYNHLHQLGLRYHTDAAGVYQFGPLDTYIHHNLIHDTAAYPYICGYAGVYLDEQSRNARVENNLVYNTDWFAYFQHKGTGNRFNNNIGAFARNGFLGRGSLNAQWKTNDLEACGNLYISSNAVAIAAGWDPGEKPPLLTNNLYLSTITNALTTAGKDTEAKMGRAPASFPKSGTALSLSAFQTVEQEAGRRIGFTPILESLKTAGLYGDAAWRALPAQFTPRTPSATWTEEDFKRLNAFTLDLNLMKPGDTPPVFQQSANEKAGFAVTSEVPGLKGKNCLKGTDRKGLVKSFYPYLYVSPRGVDTGHIIFTFAARLPERDAVPFIVEARGRRGVSETGFTLAFAADGKIKANGRPVGVLNPGQWTRFEIAFDLGAKRTGRYTLTVRGADGEKTLTIPFGKATFDQLGWLGIIAPADQDGCFYLDGLALAIDNG